MEKRMNFFSLQIESWEMLQGNEFLFEEGNFVKGKGTVAWNVHLHLILPVDGIT